MDDFQLNTPVVFLVFNRPDTTQRVFEVIRLAKPPQLLVVADGPRPDRPDDIAQCKAVREIIEKVDWNCEVLTNYAEVNMGCKRRVSSGLDWAFDHVSEAIIIEDDCLPHLTFFRFCEELLALYRNNDRIVSIVGCNFLFDRYPVEHSYYFSRISLIWGWATWQRAWKNYDGEMSLWPEIKKKKLINFFLGNNRQAKYWIEKFQKTYDQEVDSWGYRWILSCFLQNGLTIVPRTNLVSNIGFDNNATHTQNIGSSLNTIPLTAMNFPLLNPTCFIPDADADQLMHQVYCYSSRLSRLVKKVSRILKASKRP